MHGERVSNSIVKQNEQNHGALMNVSVCFTYRDSGEVVESTRTQVSNF